VVSDALSLSLVENEVEIWKLELTCVQYTKMVC